MNKEPKTLTPKQTKIKTEKVMKDINTNTDIINKKLAENVVLMRTLISSTSHVPVSESVAPEVKVEKVEKPKKTKTEPIIPEPAVVDSNRMPLKYAVKHILNKNNGKPMSQNEIYHSVIKSCGKWSRQSLYSALKDASLFVKTDDGFKLKPGASMNAPVRQSSSSDHAEEEADAFIRSVENDDSTSSVV